MPETKQFGSRGRAANVDVQARRTVVLESARHLADGVPGGPPQVDRVPHELPAGEVDHRLAMVRDPNGTQAAAYRVLRHRVVQSGAPRVLAVSSPRDREGKTTIAANLAAALAECGRAKVLLLEANLWRPSLARMFRFLPPRCFASQLEGHRAHPVSPWSTVVIPQLNLEVAAVGPERNKGRLIDAVAFTIAIEQLGRLPYDHIVIDCPSVLGAAEVNLIQDAADRVIITAAKGRTTARDLTATVDQLTDRKLLGLVLAP